MRNAETVLGIIQDRGRSPWSWITLESWVLRKAHARFGEGRLEKCRSRQLASRLLHAVAAWAAEPRTTRGGQPWYSPLAILMALTLRAVFRLAYRQAEGLLGSVIGLLGLSLRVPDHTTLSRRAATLEVPRPGNAGARAGSEPMHLLVDSTGLKLCGEGEAGQGPARIASGIPAKGSGCSRSMGRQHAGRGGRCTSAWTPAPAGSWLPP